MTALEELRRQLDLLADLKHGRLPRVDREYATAAEWERLIPNLDQLVFHRPDAIQGWPAFRLERDAAVRRWKARWDAQRLEWDWRNRSDRRISKVTPLVLERILELHEQGTPVKDIATQLGLNRQTVRNRVSEYEVKRVDRGEPARPIK